MWVRKNEVEIQNEKLQKNKRKISHRAPIIVFIASFICEIIYNITGDNLLNISDKPKNLKEMVSSFPNMLIISLTLMLLVYLWQIFFKTNLIEDNDSITVICDKCNDLKSDDGNIKCKCGGKYVNITKMKWVDDDIQSKEV